MRKKLLMIIMKKILIVFYTTFVEILFFFCKEKFEEYLDAIGYLIAIDYQRYKFDRVKLVQINDIQAQILIYLGYHKDPSDVIFIENLPEYINEGIITPLRERTNSYNSGFFNRDIFDYIIKNKHK